MDTANLSDEELFNTPVDKLLSESAPEVEEETKTESTEAVEETLTEAAPVEAESTEEVSEEPSKTEPVVGVVDSVETPIQNTEEVKEETPAKTTANVDYETGYKAIMAPFKANGKMMQVNTPEEAIALMQQGANFTRKMQELAPYRKIMVMLQNNNLNDEGKISFAIDLLNKNPEAIKKLIKDSGIDPLEIDTTVEPQYQEGNHKVTDDEARFIQEIQELRSTESGEATFKSIHSTWDDASKQVLLGNEGLLLTIHEQKESGIYDTIANEIERLRILGKIPANTPFIQAYKAVGDAMMQQGKLGAKPAPAVVATKVATPKPVVTNNQRAAAASPTKPLGSGNKFVDFTNLSDDEILKMTSRTG